MFLISHLALVDIQVLEGALVEVPTTDGTGMDRRAFGEFVGPTLVGVERGPSETSNSWNWPD
jgi:hypothetical protein